MNNCINIMNSVFAALPTGQAGLTAVRQVLRPCLQDRHVSVKPALTLFTIAILLINSAAQAQTISISTHNVQWHISDVYNVNAQLHENNNDLFTTQPDGLLLWKDVDENTKLNVSNATLSGSWLSLALDGEVYYDFTADSQPARVTIRRTNGTYSMEVELYLNEAHPQVYEISIISYTVL